MRAVVSSGHISASYNTNTLFSVYMFFYIIFQYGGDISRKAKLLKRQAEGKKKMRLIGRIEVPRDAFINILRK